MQLISPSPLPVYEPPYIIFWSFQVLVLSTLLIVSSLNSKFAIWFESNKLKLFLKDSPVRLQSVKSLNKFGSLCQSSVTSEKFLSSLSKGPLL